MAQRKCEQCNTAMTGTEKVKVTVPEEECEHCNSELYSEYTFCSKQCARDWLAQNISK
jgi:hypothetical protein